MVVIKRKEDEKFEERLQALNEEFQELKAKASEVRKKGKETGIVDVLLLDFNPKLKMARATYEESDIIVLKRLLEYIKGEIEYAEKGSEFSHALEMIEQAYELIRQDKHKEASDKYSKVMEIYKKLTPDLKHMIYVTCLDIRKRLENGT